MASPYKQQQAPISATIAAGASVTEWIATQGCFGVSVVRPSTWTTADLLIELSSDGSTSLGKLRDEDNVAVRAVCTAAGVIGFGTNAQYIGSYAYFRFVSTNTASEVAVNQVAAAALVVGLIL